MTFQYPLNKLVLSHSTRTSYPRCNRLLEFNKMFGDNSDREEAFAAEVGKALHVGSQNYLVHKDENQAVMKFLMAYPHELEFQKPENHYGRSLEACYITLMSIINSNYLDQYELVNIKTQLPGQPIMPAIEVPFAFEIVNAPLPIPVYFVGFIDAILFDKYDDRYLVTDVKTNRINVADKTVKYQYDEQTVPYGIILEHMLGKKIEEFRTSYLDAYIDIENPRVQLYSFLKTQEHINDWYKGLCLDIARIGKQYRDQWFPRATSGETCFSFNKPCWYAEECSVRDPSLLTKLVGGPNRSGLFHDGQEPWVTVKLEYVEV